MNYTKITKSAEVKTRGGAEISVEDAKNALYEFEHKQTMDANGTLIPFHAVDAVEVTSSSEQATKADPYGCDDDAPTDALTDETGNVLTDENSDPIITD